MDIKKIIYWSSIVAPLFDIILGAFNGIKELVLRYSDNRRYLEEVKKFNDDNNRRV